MKFKMNVQGRTFEVEVGDVHAHPIIAVVDGEPFEVWVEGEQKIVAQPTTSTPESPPTSLPPMQRQSPSQNGKAVHAPIPGVIVSIAVKVGDRVAIGQELCVLEAMKMKNIIYASRAGEIASVQVAIGQQVKHHETMMEYTD